MSEPTLSSVASASELIVRFGHQVVLDQATVTILEGERVGLVGRNGSGKSTFLQIASGQVQAGPGELQQTAELPHGWTPHTVEPVCAGSAPPQALRGAAHGPRL